MLCSLFRASLSAIRGGAARFVGRGQGSWHTNEGRGVGLVKSEQSVRVYRGREVEVERWREVEVSER